MEGCRGVEEREEERERARMGTITGSEAEHLLNTLQNSIHRMGWRLKARARSRLAFDIMALCSGLRPAVMVDYAGLMPELHQLLCTLLTSLLEGSKLATFLRVVAVEECAFLIHLHNLEKYIEETLSRSLLVKFVVLDDGNARFASPTEEEEVLQHLTSFSREVLPILRHDNSIRMQQHLSEDCSDLNDVPRTAQTISTHARSQCPSHVELHGILQENESVSFKSTLIDLGVFPGAPDVPLPTLNGWLLGYPIIYLFKKENSSRAIGCLSVTSIHIYKMLVESDLRIVSIKYGGKDRHKGQAEEQVLMSFTIPSDLSSLGIEEPWVHAFLKYMKNKTEREPQLWNSLEWKLTSNLCQALVL